MHYLYHYYETGSPPFQSLTQLEPDKAEQVLQQIIDTNPEFDYYKMNGGHLPRRREIESIAKQLFIEKGGRPILNAPYYASLGPSDYIASWFIKPAFIKIAIEEFSEESISFCYGDIFPIFRKSSNNGEEYRQKIYSYREILDLIEKYGWPHLNNADGKAGDIRYIEVHIWDEHVVANYR